MKISLSFCTVTFNRLWQLKRTLPHNLETLRPGEEIALVDFGSADGTQLWVWQRLAGEIAAGRLRFFEVLNPTAFDVHAAKNLAHRIARGQYLFNLDADNFLDRSDVEQIAGAAAAGAACHQWSGDWPDGSYGRIGLPRAAFEHLGGYDEKLLPMGQGDLDLLDRIKRIGLPVRGLSAPAIPAVAQTKGQKVAAIETGSAPPAKVYALMRRINRALAGFRNITEGPVRKGGFRTFSGRMNGDPVLIDGLNPPHADNGHKAPAPAAVEGAAPVFPAIPEPGDNHDLQGKLREIWDAFPDHRVRMRLRKLLPPARIHVMGCDFLAHPADNYTEFRMWRDNALPEQQEIHALLGLLDAPDPVILDVGANAGGFLIPVLRNAKGKATGIAFEPSAKMAGRLASNLDLNGLADRVSIVQQAIADHPGSSRLFYPETGDNGGARVLLTYGEEGRASDAAVDIGTLRDQVLHAGLRRIDVLKADVEGLEDRVIVPFLQAADTPRPGLLYFEVTHRDYWTYDLITVLEQAGYEPARQFKKNWIFRRRSQ